MLASRVTELGLEMIESALKKSSVKNICSSVLWDNKNILGSVVQQLAVGPEFERTWSEHSSVNLFTD